MLYPRVYYEYTAMYWYGLATLWRWEHVIVRVWLLNTQAMLCLSMTGDDDTSVCMCRHVAIVFNIWEEREVMIIIIY